MAMRDYEELVRSLRENAEWAEGNIWEVPIMLPNNLNQAADAIEELQTRIDLAVGLYNRNVEKTAMYEALIGISPEPPKEESK